MSLRRSRSLGFLRRFGRDGSGVSAVEFALLAPVLILVYFGLAEFCQAYMAQRRMGHATSQVADIVAQYQTVDAELIDDTFAIGGLVLSPFPDAPLKLRVTGITRGADGVAKVTWSRGWGEGMTARSGVVEVPAGLIANGEGIIMSEGTYDYVSPLGQVLTTKQFSHTYWLRPRLVNAITCTDC